MQSSHQDKISQDIRPRKQREEAAADSDTIKISSDEEETTTKTFNTSSIASDIFTLGCNIAPFEQRNRCRTPNRSPCDTSSSSSAISSSLRSFDYEAEADEEDANECEGMELQRKLAGGNENLMHVQNFLSYFDGQRQQRKQKSTAICCVPQLQPEMLRQPEKHNVDKYVAMGSTDVNQLTTYVAQHAVDDLMTPQRRLDFMSTTANTTVTTALTTTITPTTTIVNTAKAGNKLCKFTISTKFLRKPRHKLKSVNLAPTVDANNVLAKTTTTKSTDKVLAMQVQQELNVNKPMSLEQERQRQQPGNADEPNVKFNSNFSINSLLNKK